MVQILKVVEGFGCLRRGLRIGFTTAVAAASMFTSLSAEIGIGWENGWVAEWKGDVPGLEVRDTSAKVRDGLVKVVRRWTWTGKEPLEKVTLSVRYRVKGDPKSLKPFMPGILMYGNPSNAGRKDGRVPVFAGEKGEFAIFEEHRLPMPFVLLENVNGQDARCPSGCEFVAIHTLPSPIRGAVREDLWWSIGVEVAEGGTDIVMLSGPIGYNRRRSVAKARQGAAMTYDETYITLRPGQIVEKTFWVQTGTATQDAFGFEQAMDVSLDLFKPYRTDCYESFERIFRVKRDYAMTRWMEDRGAFGFNMYEGGDGMIDVYENAHKRREIVLGWCGCGATCGYALPVLDIDKGDWDKAQKSLDFISDTFGGTIRPADGLFNVRYNVDTGKTLGGDPVSCGQSLNSIVKAIRFAEKSGGRLNPAKWRIFAEKALDAIAASILKPDWQEPKSTNAGFLVAPLVAGAEIFGKKEHLAAAKKLAAVFERRYFGYEGVYWGGTLDARCEDKEGAYAAFQGYAALLRNAVNGQDARCPSAEEKKYARLARHAMNMMLTYTMVWDATYPPGRLSDHAFKSTGWTVVSAQNQHLDAFGVLTTPEIWRMGEYLKDDRLKKLAAVMFRSCFQLTDASGSLGEQIQHTNFGQRGDMSDVYRLRGGYAERWTVFWLTAHFLNAAAEFKEMAEARGGNCREPGDEMLTWFGTRKPAQSGWRLRYDKPADWSMEGWRTASLPLGNGWFGTSEFGGVDVERLQLTEPSFQTRQLLYDRADWPEGNLTDAADVSVDFGHKDATGYVRELDLATGLASVGYSAGGVDYAREYFASHPDKVGVMRFSSSRKGALSFTLDVAVPFPDDKWPLDRTGSVKADGDEIRIAEESGTYRVKLAGCFKVLTDGKVSPLPGRGALRVDGASEATVVYSLATNYRLCPGMFTPMHGDRDRSADFGPDPMPEAARRVADAARLGYAALRKRHVEDFAALVGRSEINLDYDKSDMALTTPQLRRRGSDSNYLSMLQWRLGKYLLASSSRPGGLPGSLQGIWSGPVSKTAWGSGYWHNINVQMVYWPTFSCNMAECFEAYAAYCEAFRPVTREQAKAYLAQENPAGLKEPFSDDLWSIGTAAWPFELQCTPSRPVPNGHSGPGTGGLTTAMFTDWYDFTQDRAVLERRVWPALHGMADFLTRCVVETNGLWLSSFSASPEQLHRKEHRRKLGVYCHTVGCAFDQQMIEANNAALVRFAKTLGREGDPVVRRCREQLGKYESVIVGESGQIKEFREERRYGEIGDPRHRHISHLCGVYPSAIVSRATPEWLKAASRTLDLRGDRTHAWAIAHRACCRARTGEGDKAMAAFDILFRDRLTDALWAKIGKTQEIDANLGYTAAAAEMLLQSDETDESGNFVIDLLPALPKKWASHGSFRGLCARGGWMVDCEWRDGKPVSVALRPGTHAAARPLVRHCGKPWHGACR